MTTGEHARRVELDGPYDLERSLLLSDYGGRNPTLARPRPGELIRAVRTPSGPGTVHVRVDADAVEARASGPGASWLLDALPGYLGLDDRPPVFEGKAGRLQRRIPGLCLGRALDLFEILTNYVIRQRVAWRDAVSTQVRILRAHAEPAPGPADLRLPLSPAQWSSLTTAELAAFGLERKRAKTILGLAARAERVRSFASLPPDQFAHKLEAFPGIGPWTRANAQARALPDPDAVPLGDYALPSMVSWFFVREPRATDARMLELLEPYRGDRYRIIHLLWAAGVHAPRFGPRIRGTRP